MDDFREALAVAGGFNDLRPGVAMTITSRIPEASALAKEFRDGKRSERIAVSVDMLSTGYNCRDLLNIALMRPVFSPTEYIQIKGRGTRRFTFKIEHTEYEKQRFFLLDFCAVAEYFEEKYDYTLPLKLLRAKKAAAPPRASAPGQGETLMVREDADVGAGTETPLPPREIPVWQGVDTLVSTEVRIVGPDGEKVDVMTFRGGYERDIKEFVSQTPALKDAVEAGDDDAVETIVNERSITGRACSTRLTSSSSLTACLLPHRPLFTMPSVRSRCPHATRSSPTPSTPSPPASTCATASKSGWTPPRSCWPRTTPRSAGSSRAT